MSNLTASQIVGAGLPLLISSQQVMSWSPLQTEELNQQVEQNNKVIEVLIERQNELNTQEFYFNESNSLSNSIANFSGSSSLTPSKNSGAKDYVTSNSSSNSNASIPSPMPNSQRNSNFYSSFKQTRTFSSKSSSSSSGKNLGRTPTSSNSNVNPSGNSSSNSSSGSIANNDNTTSPDSAKDPSIEGSTSELIAKDLSEILLYKNIEKIITLAYDGNVSAESCSVSNLVNLIESTACSCENGVCQLGLTSVVDYVGLATFTYSLTKQSLISNSASAMVSIFNTGGPFPGDVYDNLNPKNYDNNFGSYNWDSNWIENGESDGPLSGVIKVDNKALPGPNQCAAGNCFVIGSNLGISGVFSIERKVNLAGASSATLEFDWRRDSSVGYFSSQNFLIEISSDGGANWAPVFIIPSGGSDASTTFESLDISSYISHEVIIRLNTQNSLLDGFVYIDNFKILGSN